jgi:hypothetical protein
MTTHNYKPKRKHKLKHHTWVDGVLEAGELFFDSIEDAIEYAEQVIIADVVKIWNEFEELVFELTNCDDDTDYA